MAESLTIARPYAEAAFKLARELNALPSWSEALGRLAVVQRASRIPGLRRITDAYTIRLLKKRLRTAFVVLLAALTTASFVYAIVAHQDNQSLAYYNSFARAWELLLGALAGALVPSTREYFRFWGLDREKLAWANPGARVMHPGPMNRGVEIDSDVADDLSVSLIQDQVEMGVAARMAVLASLSARWGDAR